MRPGAIREDESLPDESVAARRSKETIAVIDGLVSIITPCYNGEKFIAETIESVMGQTCPDWEMIVVDDGSTDRTAEIARGYVERDGRIQLVCKPNGGTASARNEGMRRAKGRYIALLDADDVWEKDFLECQLDFLRQKDAICVCSAYSHIDAQSREIQHPTVPLPVITPSDMRVMNRIGCLTGLYDSKRHGKVYLHEQFRSVRDDYAYWYDIVSLAGKAYGNPRVLARYRVLPGSTTGNKLELVSRQYAFYRGYLHLNIPTAAINTVRWAVNGIRKFS